MDSPIKQRLIGAAVLAALAVIFLPMLLKGPDVKEPDAAAVPLSMPATPGQEFETRELPLTVPDSAPPGGVLGMNSARPRSDVEAAGSTGVVGNGNANSTADGSANNGTQARGSNTADSNLPGSSTTASPAPTRTEAAPVPGAASGAAAVVAPAKSVPEAAVAAGNYAVNIGAFSNMVNATALAEKLRVAGLPVSADRVTLASGPALRLRVGPYADRAAAEAARLRAEPIAGGVTKVIALDAALPDAAAVVQPPRTTATAAAKVTTSPSSPSTKPAGLTLPASTKPATSKPATSAAAGPTKPATASAGFAVQLSAPSVEADALALRDRARAQGFNSFVQRIETESGVRYRVRVGPVADRSAAESLRDAVNAKLGSKGIIVANP